jgi:hypothetical protein
VNSEIGKLVYRTSRGEPINGSPRANKTDTADVFGLSDLFGESTDDADTVDGVFQKAEAAQRRRDAEQLEALRKQLRQPITAGYFSELARGGHGPSSAINCFFSDGEAKS